MVRKTELTWQTGSKGRGGRWRKWHKGRAYHFPGGKGRSDREAYNAAVTEWRRLKVKLEQEIIKPHQEDYGTAIAEWDAVLRWSVQHGDDAHAGLARDKIKNLQRRLTGPKPRPLEECDRFMSQFKPPPHVDLGNLLGHAWLDEPADMRKAAVVAPAEHGFPDRLDGSERRINGQLWHERIANVQQSDPDKSVSGNITRFLKQKQDQADSGKLSAARYTSLRLHLDALREFAGGETPVSTLGGGLLTDFMSDLLRQVGAQKISHNYAKDRLDAAKMFIRWCWRMDTIEHLPRDIDSSELRIGRDPAEIRPYTADQIKRLLGEASSRTKLYILLALNTGATQVDIADLQQSEVNWAAGVITRKRSKTKRHKRVPEVAWALWPETLRLLKEQRAEDGDRVLVNENGGPLRTETLSKDGRIAKTDNVRSAFARLCRKLKIEAGEFKRFRKTSASLLRESNDYASIVNYFLGHSPQSMSDRHYAKPPQKLLDEAIEWLGKEYGIIKAPSKSKEAGGSRAPSKQKKKSAS